ncbi:cyclin-dependent protein kinase inhibitor SMR6 [Malania oleifera]|uniref:cyclin-dependent protein kinase inhibitor SMR6 n=1 Tax=Malania oleifera TaxID=397392 RepID=UPI0025AE6937|nr:cyclin-dependent protein kinase inhibitor SMR6 [Malania oleifera]
MGFAGKSQAEGGLESEGKKWVIAGISMRGPLKQVCTKAREKESEEEEEACSTTPTGKEARIPERLLCPPAPRKRRPASTCHSNGAREFFITPPDLESVFIPRVGRSN